MEYIYTPWREEYIKKLYKMKACIFCKALKQKNDKEALILLRGTHNFILLNRYPYTPGHLMIVPYKHISLFEEEKKAHTDEMMDLCKLSLKILKKCYHPHGFNTGMNLGHSAGAGVADHYHLHVICRWVGDSNFMPLVGKTKLTIEDLDKTYDKLFPLFQKEKRKLGF
ncbi:MAG: HIT domain-containing protein [Candidatus Aminicenantales bacterium]